MPEEEQQPGLLDRAVELLARLMNSLGLNGNRILWKWGRRKRRMAEAGVRTEILLRSAKGGTRCAVPAAHWSIAAPPNAPIAARPCRR